VAVEKYIDSLLDVFDSSTRAQLQHWCRIRNNFWFRRRKWSIFKIKHSCRFRQIKESLDN
jgi:hypothetical protein